MTIGVLLIAAFAAQSWPKAACLSFNVAVFLLAARRLHDMGHTGWWIALVPAGQVVAVVVASLARLPTLPTIIVISAATTGTIILIGLFAGQPGANRFGSGPLATWPWIRYRASP